MTSQADKYIDDGDRIFEVMTIIPRDEKQAEALKSLLKKQIKVQRKKRRK